MAGSYPSREGNTKTGMPSIRIYIGSYPMCKSLPYTGKILANKPLAFTVTIVFEGFPDNRQHLKLTRLSVEN
jgi:hypothetical protein